MMDEMQIGMDKTFEILDKVDILSLYDTHKQMRVCDLMDKSNSTLRSMMDDSFENEFFNFVSECEFIDYLDERYGRTIRFNEVTTTYTYL